MRFIQRVRDWFIRWRYNRGKIGSVLYGVGFSIWYEGRHVDGDLVPIHSSKKPKHLKKLIVTAIKKSIQEGEDTI